MRIYLAGPIMGTSDAEMLDWREDMRARLPGHEIIDPTVRDYRGVEDQNVERIVEGDKSDIDSVEVLIAYCPKPSVGTSMEVYYAWATGKTVLVYVPPGVTVSPWLRYHSHEVRNYAMQIAGAVTSRS